MSVILTNRFIIVNKDDPSFFPLRMNLTFNSSGVRKVYKNKNGKTEIREIRYNNTDQLFSISDNNDMYIMSGLYDMLSSEGYFNKSEIVDGKKLNKFYDIFDIDINECKNILDGIDLRSEQLIALRKMFFLKRCIIQLPTGAGKTEIMCAFIKYFYKYFNEYPTSLVVENNINLVNSTIDRFNKYNIPVTSYRDNRYILKGFVNVCHPSSLNNDLSKNKDLLDDIVVLLYDECHHAKSQLSTNIYENCKNIIYSIGVSASVISQDHIGCKKVVEFSPDELRVIGVTGKLALNMTSGYLIDKETLALPVLFRFYNPANEYINVAESGNWHKIQDVRLSSDSRNEIIVRCSEFFNRKNRKVLILVNTIKWAKKLLVMFDDYGLSDITCASYGGERFEKYDIELKEFVNAGSDVLDEFKRGDVEILIGTTHIYEGADIPNLDVIILAYGGRKERLQVQGIGRALRKTKNGKYAYIVDFTDDEDLVLSRQSRERFKRYKEDMNISDDRIFNNISIGEISDIFSKLEED